MHRSVSGYLGRNDRGWERMRPTLSFDTTESARACASPRIVQRQCHAVQRAELRSSLIGCHACYTFILDHPRTWVTPTAW